MVDIGQLVAGIGPFVAASTGDLWWPVAHTVTGHLWLWAVVRTVVGLAAPGTGSGGRLAGPATVVAVQRT